MKNLIVLSGGGFKAAYQAGVLKQLQDNGVYPHCVMGTSGGALNGVLASCVRINDMDDIWNSIAEKGASAIFESELLDLNKVRLDFKKLLKVITPFIGLGLLTKKGRESFTTILKAKIESIEYLATSEGLKTLLRENVNIKDVKMPFFFNFNDLVSGEEIITSEKDYIDNEEFINGIVASASIPLMLKPQKVFTRNAVYSSCVDGGISSNVLISKAIKYIKSCPDAEYWRIIVIDCNSPKLERLNKFNGAVSIFERVVLGIMLNTLSKKEVSSITTINELASSTNSYIHIPFYVIAPESNDLGGTMEISKSLNSHRLERGIQDANKFLKLI